MSHMTTKRIPADDIIRDMIVVPPGKKRPVTVVDHWDNGGQAEVAYTNPSGRGVFFISRYADIEFRGFQS